MFPFPLPISLLRLYHHFMTTTPFAALLAPDLSPPNIPPINTLYHPPLLLHNVSQNGHSDLQLFQRSFSLLLWPSGASSSSRRYSRRTAHHRHHHPHPAHPCKCALDARLRQGTYRYRLPSVQCCCCDLHWRNLAKLYRSYGAYVSACC